VGRQHEVQRLRALITQRRNVLVFGPIGIGKTAVVRATVEQLEHVVWVSSIAPLKAALQEIALRLVQIGRIAATEQETVRRLPIPALAQRLTTALEGCVLVLDRLEQATPSMAPALEALMTAPVTVGIATELPTSPKLTRVWWRFVQKVTLEPMQPEVAQQLFWSRVDRHAVPQPRLWDRLVVAKGGGNPLAILALATQAAADPSAVSIEHPAGRREVDLTPVLLCLGAVIVAARFVALGLNDVDTYILAGIGGAFFIVARYFIYRLLRQRAR